MRKQTRHDREVGRRHFLASSMAAFEVWGHAGRVSEPVSGALNGTTLEIGVGIGVNQRPSHFAADLLRAT